ncbi:MAG: GNAT family N-acetyltransferase [Armatimonadetes bacterium]|nr:GNAT family N-acetyltransferase [Armatimonadota bacterium]
MKQMPLGYSISEVGARHLHEIALLRARVWSAMGVPVSSHLLVDGGLQDQWDATGTHFAAFHLGVIVAAARVNIGGPHDLCYGSYILKELADAEFPSAELFRLVVDSLHRGAGLGAALDSTRIELAKAFNCHAVYGMTFTRPAMLLNKGFEVISEVSSEDYLKINGYDSSERCFFMRKLL